MPKDSATLKNSHGGYAGRTIIQRIEEQVDKRRKVMEQFIIEHGIEMGRYGLDYARQQGRYEGMAAALSMLRETTLQEELSRSNERLGIGQDG